VPSSPSSIILYLPTQKGGDAL